MKLKIGNIYEIVTLKKIFPQQWKQESYTGILINSNDSFVEIIDNEKGIVRLKANSLFEVKEIGK